LRRASLLRRQQRLLVALLLPLRRGALLHIMLPPQPLQL
jgi:hypothetical protein